MTHSIPPTEQTIEAAFRRLITTYGSEKALEILAVMFPYDVQDDPAGNDLSSHYGSVDLMH